MAAVEHALESPPAGMQGEVLEESAAQVPAAPTPVLERVLESLRSSIREHEHGYLVVEGVEGQERSLLLRMLASDPGPGLRGFVVALGEPALQGRTPGLAPLVDSVARTGRVLPPLRLAAVEDLEELLSRFPHPPDCLGAYLGHLQARQAEGLVMILDEIDRWEALGEGGSSLEEMVPSELPAGCFVVLGCQPGHAVAARAQERLPLVAHVEWPKVSADPAGPARDDGAEEGNIGAPRLDAALLLETPTGISLLPDEPGRDALLATEDLQGGLLAQMAAWLEMGALHRALLVADRWVEVLARVGPDTIPRTEAFSQELLLHRSEACRRLRQVSWAESDCLQLLDSVHLTGSSGEAARPRHRVAEAWRRLAAVYLDREDAPAALHACASGAQFCRDDTTEGLRLLASLHRYRGLALDSMGRFDEASSSLGKAIGLLEPMVEGEGSSPLLRRDLSRLHADLARALLDMDMVDVVYHHCTLCIETLQALDSQVRQASVRAELALAFQARGEVRDRLGHAEGAREDALQALCEMQDLVQSEGCFDLRSPLAQCHRTLAHLEADAGRDEGASVHLEAATRVLGALLAEGRSEFQPVLARTHDAAALCLTRLRRLPEALIQHDDAIRAWEQVPAGGLRDEAALDLAASLNNRGLALGSAGRREQALADFQRAVSLYETSAARDDCPEAQADLGLTLFNKAGVHRRAGEWAEAKREYSAAIGILERLDGAASGSSASCSGAARDLASAVLSRGLCHLVIGEQDAALADFSCALTLCRAPAPQQEPGAVEGLAAVALSHRARIHLVQLHPDDALADLDDALRAWDVVVATDRCPSCQRGRGLTLRCRSEALRGLHRSEEARAALEASIDAYRALVDEGSDDDDTRVGLAEALLDLGSMRAGDGLADEARSCFEEGLHLVRPDTHDEEMCATGIASLLRCRMARLHIDQGRTEEAILLLDEALSAPGEGLPSTRRASALARAERARALMRLGDATGALEEVTRAVAALDPTSSEGMSPHPGEDLARVLAVRASVFEGMGLTAEALEDSDRALQIYSPLVEMQGRSLLWAEVASLYAARALLHSARGDAVAALGDLGWALDLYTELLTLPQFRCVRLPLARATLARARILMAEKRTPEAMADLERGTLLYEAELVEQPPDRLPHDLISSILTLGCLALQREDHDTATLALRRAVALGQCTESGDPRESLTTWTQLVTLAEELQEGPEVLLACDGLVACLEQICATDADASFSEELSFACQRRGELLGASGDLARAMDDFSRALEMTPLDPTCEARRGLLHMLRGHLAARLGLHAEALADYESALSLYRDEDMERLSPAFLVLVARMHNNVGVLRQALGTGRDALEPLERAVRICSGAPRSAGMQAEQASALANRGHVLADLQQFGAAMEDQARAIQSFAQLLGQSGEVDVRRALGIALHEHGCTLLHAGQEHEALGDLSAALEQLADVAEETQDTGDLRDLAGAFTSRALVLRRGGSETEAVMDLVRATRLYRMLTEQRGCSDLRRDLDRCRSLLEVGHLDSGVAGSENGVAAAEPVGQQAAPNQDQRESEAR